MVGVNRSAGALLWPWAQRRRRDLAFLISLATAILSGRAEPFTTVDFLSWTSLSSFSPASSASGSSNVWISRAVATRIEWRELVASWNTGTNTPIDVEVRCRWGEHLSRFYQLGHWSLETNAFPRLSITGQSDADGEVQTDTLVLRRPATNVQVRLTFPTGTHSGFRFLGLSLLNTSGASTPANAAEPPAAHPAWNRVLDVPRRSQAEYPEGITQWCSPTSLTMVLAYYAQQLGRPSLRFKVPDVAHAVYDPAWPGTGNWSFNIAFAGAQPGLRASVVRLPDMASLESWIARDTPMIASVSYALLNGRTRVEAGDGHLVVVAGFDAKGDVVLNDPGVRLERVRRTIPRAAFERAWAHSRNTVYLVHPTTVAAPPFEGVAPAN